MTRKRTRDGQKELEPEEVLGKVTAWLKEQPVDWLENRLNELRTLEDSDYVPLAMTEIIGFLQDKFHDPSLLEPIFEATKTHDREQTDWMYTYAVLSIEYRNHGVEFMNRDKTYDRKVARAIGVTARDLQEYRKNLRRDERSKNARPRIFRENYKMWMKLKDLDSPAHIKLNSAGFLETATSLST